MKDQYRHPQSQSLYAFYLNYYCLHFLLTAASSVNAAMTLAAVVIYDHDVTAYDACYSLLYEYYVLYCLCILKL